MGRGSQQEEKRHKIGGKEAQNKKGRFEAFIIC